MKLAYDFHIHTALSPCADADMTPNNIVNMAVLKELDVIAITDHNSAENCQPCVEAAANKGIIVIPGMELQTKEEVHMLCMFRNIELVMVFQNYINSRLTGTMNTPQVFGNQLIFNKNDEIVGEENRMLISSVNISIKEACRIVEDLYGLIIPAHVDRTAYSIISNLGFIPKELPLKIAEVSKTCQIDRFLYNHPELSDYQFIRNSDAHYLMDIMERDSTIEVEENTIECIFDALRNKIVS